MTDLQVFFCTVTYNMFPWIPLAYLKKSSADKDYAFHIALII